MHGRRRARWLGGAAWVASVAALGASVWLVWRAVHQAPAALPAVQVTVTATPDSVVSTATPDEVTHEERQSLEAVLRRKGGETP